MWRGPQEYIAHEFVFTSPVASHMSVAQSVGAIEYTNYMSAEG